jgi:hypothetical protein
MYILCSALHIDGCLLTLTYVVQTHLLAITRVYKHDKNDRIVKKKVAYARLECFNEVSNALRKFSIWLCCKFLHELHLSANSYCLLSNDFQRSIFLQDFKLRLTILSPTLPVTKRASKPGNQTLIQSQGDQTSL